MVKYGATNLLSFCESFFPPAFIKNDCNDPKQVIHQVAFMRMASYRSCLGMTYLLPYLPYFKKKEGENAQFALNWGKKNGFPLPPSIYFDAISHRSIDTLKWAIQNGCVWNVDFTSTFVPKIDEIHDKETIIIHAEMIRLLHHANANLDYTSLYWGTKFVDTHKLIFDFIVDHCHIVREDGMIVRVVRRE